MEDCLGGIFAVTQMMPRSQGAPALAAATVGSTRALACANWATEFGCGDRSSPLREGVAKRDSDPALGAGLLDGYRRIVAQPTRKVGCAIH